MNESEKHGPGCNSEGDIIWGAEEIGVAIRRSKRQAIHMLENGLLPAKKVGRLWVANRQQLLRAVTPAIDHGAA